MLIALLQTISCPYSHSWCVTFEVISHSLIQHREQLIMLRLHEYEAEQTRSEKLGELLTQNNFPHEKFASRNSKNWTFPAVVLASRNRRKASWYFCTHRFLLNCPLGHSRPSMNHLKQTSLLYQRKDDITCDEYTVRYGRTRSLHSTLKIKATIYTDNTKEFQLYFTVMLWDNCCSLQSPFSVVSVKWIGQIMNEIQLLWCQILLWNLDSEHKCNVNSPYILASIYSKWKIMNY